MSDLMRRMAECHQQLFEDSEMIEDAMQEIEALHVAAQEMRDRYSARCDDIARLTEENEQLKSELRSMALDALATLEPIE